MANKRIGIFAALVLVAVAVTIASSGSVAQGFHNRVSKVDSLVKTRFEEVPAI